MPRGPEGVWKHLGAVLPGRHPGDPGEQRDECREPESGAGQQLRKEGQQDTAEGPGACVCLYQRGEATPAPQFRVLLPCAPGFPFAPLDDAHAADPRRIHAGRRAVATDTGSAGQTPLWLRDPHSGAHPGFWSAQGQLGGSPLLPPNPAGVEPAPAPPRPAGPRAPGPAALLCAAVTRVRAGGRHGGGGARADAQLRAAAPAGLGQRGGGGPGRGGRRGPGLGPGRARAPGAGRAAAAGPVRPGLDRAALRGHRAPLSGQCWGALAGGAQGQAERADLGGRPGPARLRPRSCTAPAARWRGGREAPPRGGWR